MTDFEPTVVDVAKMLQGLLRGQLGIEGDMIVEYTGADCTCGAFGCYQHCGVVPAEPVDRVLAEVDAVIEAGR